MELNGTLTHCREDQVHELLLALLEKRGIKSIQAWEEAYLPPKMLERLRASGIQVDQAPDPDIQAGLTGALAGVAETGTLVITGGPSRPLTASLLPEIHIAVLKAADLHANLADALNLKEVREATSAILISGPSRTADIEMTLTIGVHGPRELHVFCLEPPAPNQTQ